MFFTNHYLGLLGFLMIPAFWWVLTEDRHSQSPPLVLARLLLCLGIVWFLFSAIELRYLKLLPRYYMVAAYSFFLASAIWVYVKIWPQRRKLVVAVTMIFAVVNLGLISLDNNNPRFGERALVEYLGESTGPIHTDPLTAHKVEFLCKWASQDYERIITSPPVYGSTFFYNQLNADHPNYFVTPDKVKLYAANKQWQEIWKKQAPRKASAVLAEKLGIIQLLPKMLVSKLEGPNTNVFVYKLPE